MALPSQQAHDLLQQADLIVTADEARAAVERVAREINAALADAQPLVLSVMGGAVVFSGQLLPLLAFPLDFDYVHVSRYGGGLTEEFRIKPSITGQNTDPAAALSICLSNAPTRRVIALTVTQPT